MSFKVTKFNISDVLLIHLESYSDKRGTFTEIFREGAFNDLEIPNNFVQDNLVHSKKNVLRGLHYQTPPMSQGKLVNVVKGKIFDVAVDIRPESDTFGKHISLFLSDTDNNILFVPEGFAHGYLVVSDSAIITYKTTKEYNLESEGGIIWNDSKLQIDWPIEDPLLSDKDEKLLSFHTLQSNIFDKSKDYKEEYIKK